jgi:hypothetical protein
MPKQLPDMIGFGDDSEVISFIGDYGSSWRQTPKAIDWLRTTVDTTRARAIKGPMPTALALLAASCLLAGFAGCHASGSTWRRGGRPRADGGANAERCMSQEAASPERERTDRQNDRAFGAALAAAHLTIVSMERHGPAGLVPLRSVGSDGSLSIAQESRADQPDQTWLVSGMTTSSPLLAQGLDGKVHEIHVRRNVVSRRERTICGCDIFGGSPPVGPGPWFMKLPSAEGWGDPIVLTVDEIEIVDARTEPLCLGP